MARTVTGVDIGTRANKFLRGSYKGNTFHVSGASIVRSSRTKLTSVRRMTADLVDEASGTNCDDTLRIVRAL